MSPLRVILIGSATLAILVLASAAPSLSAEVEKYYHLDAVGSVRAITDRDGNVLERFDYHPFGENLNPPPTSSNTRRFTGKERDPETAVIGGLDYFGARYYFGRVARFTSVDPVYNWRVNMLDPQRWNRYAYGRNNPLRYVDPDGRDTLDSIIAYFNRVVGLNYQPAVVMQEGKRPEVVGMPDKKTVAKAMIVVGAVAVVSDILVGAERGKESKYTVQYRKEGGFDQANQDFDALSPQDVRDRGKGMRTGILEGGDKVVVRPQSSEGSPTLEIQRQDDKTIKVRYPEPKPLEPK